MKFNKADVLLSEMSRRFVLGVLRKDSEFFWLKTEVTKAYLKLKKLLNHAEKRNWSEQILKRKIKNLIFSEPYVGMLFFDKDVKSSEEAFFVSYQYFKFVNKYYIKNTGYKSEFNIYQFLKYRKTEDLYNTSIFKLKFKIRQYKDPNYKKGNIEKSTLISMSYLSKYFKKYLI